MDTDKFFAQYRNGDRALGSRLSTMRIALSLLNSNKKNVFVETGTTRKNHITHPRVEDRAADGSSTVIFAHYASLCNGRVWTCDLEEENIQNCKIATEEYKNYVNYIVSDSVEFLSSFDQKIDFLYLDSVDSHLPFAASHQLKEIQAAYDKLHDRSVILLDDLGAKTKESIPFLQEKNWCQISIHVPQPSHYNNVNQAIFVPEKFLYVDHSSIPESLRFQDTTL